MTFAVDITRFIEKTGLRADTVIRKLAFDAFAGVLLRSPVDTGRFRSSWRIGVDTVDLSVEPERDAPSNVQPGTDPNGAEIGYAQSKVAQARFGQTVAITNSLPYALALENGHSKQAPGPQAIAGRTFDELVARFAETVRQVTQEVP